MDKVYIVLDDGGTQYPNKYFQPIQVFKTLDSAMNFMTEYFRNKSRDVHVKVGKDDVEYYNIEDDYYYDHPHTLIRPFKLNS